MTFDVDLGGPAGAGPRRRPTRSGGPTRLLLIGDFRGDSAATAPPLRQRSTLEVDFDRLDGAIARWCPSLQTPAGRVEFATLDDFHPDALLSRVPVFQALRSLRQRLAEPSTFAAAAAELGVAGPGAGSARASPAAAGASQPEPSLLSSLLGGQSAASAAPAVAKTSGPGGVAGALDAIVRAAVAPHITADIAAQQAQLLHAVDTALTDQMRGLLHAPAFRQLESAWRGVQWLIASLPLDSELQIHLFDARRDELLEDLLAAQGQIAQTGLYHALLGADAGAADRDDTGWSSVTAVWRVGPSDEDLALLTGLGALAWHVGAPLLAGADLALAGVAEDPALASWQAMRRSAVAPWIGLAAPGVLLRLPYGPGRDAVEGFAFDELGTGLPASSMLWGPAGLACTVLVGRAAAQQRDGLTPDGSGEIDDLPACVVEQDGEKALHPCTEQTLEAPQVDQLMGAGLMPLMHHRHRPAVTLRRWQSVAWPAQVLQGFPAV